MSEPTIRLPDMAETDIAVIVADHEGNYSVLVMEEKALDLAEIPALGRTLRLLASNLLEPEDHAL